MIIKMPVPISYGLEHFAPFWVFRLLKGSRMDIMGLNIPEKRCINGIEHNETLL